MGEVVRINTGMRLTKVALHKIDSAADRLSRSRAAIVEILAYLYADQLSGDTMVPAAAVPPDSRSPKRRPGGKAKGK